MVNTLVLLLSTLLFFCAYSQPTLQPNLSPSCAPTLFSPTSHPTPLLSALPEATMGSVKKAVFQGALITCLIASFGIFLGCANRNHDRARARRKRNKVIDETSFIVGIGFILTIPQ
jgi:hypothetical protein